MTHINLESLSPLQKIALANALVPRDSTTKMARAAIQPGEHEIPPFQVEVSGSLKVAEDEDYTPTTSISLIGTVLLAVRRMGIQRGPFLKVMKEICTEALLADEQTRGAIMAGAELGNFEEAFRSEFTSQLPQKTRKGKIIRGGLTVAAQ